MPASAFVNRDHAGGAVDTTITAPIVGTTLTITIEDATGWPTGGANGPFHTILSYDVAGKEKVEVQSRSGTTLTIADTGKRGIDGTAAAAHAFGAKIRHCYTAIDAQEANDHITNTTLDHHTQYHNATRHAAVAHTQAMLATDSVGAAQILAGAVGSSELAAAAVTAGKIATGGISAAGQFAAGVVDNAALGADAVTSAKILNGTIADADLAAGVIANGAAALGTNQNLMYVQATDPGAVGNGKVWFDTTTREIKVRNAANTGWDTFSYPSVERNHSTTNFFNNVTLGTGGTAYRDYAKIGDFVYVTYGFVLGTGGDVTGQISAALPFNAASLASGEVFPGGARAVDAGVNSVYSGTCEINPVFDATVIRAPILTGAAAEWDATTPFNWAVGDRCFLFGGYWTT